MNGLDTNVLVRYIVQDDPKQSKAANRLMEKRCTTGDPGWISLPVLVELVWVLTGAYGYSRSIVQRVLHQLLSTAELRVEEPDLAWAALRAYENGSADFSDYLIGIGNRRRGCKTTFTFDRKAGGSDWFSVVADG